MSAPTDRSEADTERDAHLLAALRHAPDRDAVPPTALSAAILARAKAAAQSQGASRSPRGWQRVAAWFARPPAQWSAAFGTLAVASLVAVMWSTHEPPAPTSVPDAPSAVPSPTDSPAAQADQAEKETREIKAAPAREEDRSDRSAAPPQAAAAKRDNAKAAIQQRLPPPPATAAPAPAPAAADNPAAHTATAPTSVGEMKAASPATPAAQQAPRAMTDAAPPSSPQAAAPAGAAAERPEALRQRATGAAERYSAKRAAQADDPLSRLDAIIDSTPDAVTWRRDGKAWPHGPAQRQSWAQLHEATRGRWQRDDGVRRQMAPWLVLSAGPAAEAVIWIEGNTLWLIQGADTWKAALPESSRRELQDAVARW